MSTLLDLGTSALRKIGAIPKGAQPDANDGVIIQDVATSMLDGWAAQRLTIVQTIGNTFPLTAGKQFYAIGAGGDFNIARPLWIPNAGILLTDVTPNLERPLNIMSDDEYAAVPLKTLQSAIPTDMYYDFGYTGPATLQGKVYPIPIPNGGRTVSIVLYLPIPLTNFADLNVTQYTFPPGYKEALIFQLGLRLADEYGKDLPTRFITLAALSFGIIKRANIRKRYLRSDSALLGRRGQSRFNWRTGGFGRRH